MVDDCHATGIIGPGGRGSAALQGVADRIDIVTGTFGKALGGAMGGFVAASADIIDMLRQRARPYLFSNAPSPAVCGAALKAIEIARSEEGDARRSRIRAVTERLRTGLTAAGFEVSRAESAITPVIFGDERIASSVAGFLFEAGLLVTAFSYPVVPRGRARIRLQSSASHTDAHVDTAVAAIAAGYAKAKGEGA